MPILGLGIHFLIAIFFAVHAMRNRREMYWLVILFSFPVLGSVVYFFAIYLPHSRLEQGLRQVGKSAMKTLDPGRDVREAQARFELTPTAQNQVALANAHLAAGQHAEAVAQFDACLQGPFANDLEICLAAARARLAHGQAAGALTLLQKIRAQNAEFRAEQVGLAMAQALAADGQREAAGREFADVAARSDSIEARVEYAIWLVQNGQPETANRVRADLEKTRGHLPPNARELNQPLFRRLDAAFANAAR